MANRMSTYSMASDGGVGPRRPGQNLTQVSTTTLLNAVHNSYLSSQPYQLDAGSSLVVNTWLTASQCGVDGRVGGTVDTALAARAWEHARRRAEDGCVILGSLHHSNPSLLRPFLASFPMSMPSTLFKALEAIEPFLQCVTPYNPSLRRQSALSVSLTLTLSGNLSGATIALSQGGIDTEKGLLSIPAEAGYRAFDVFYYLLTSASTPAEREFLGLTCASDYEFLARSGTYDPPAYLPTADDGAAADDFRSALKEIGIKGAAHRNFITTLAGLLKLGNTVASQMDQEVLEDSCEDVGGLLGMEPEILSKQCSTEDRSTFIAGLYEALVDWVICKANEAIASQLGRVRDGDECSSGDSEARTVNESSGDNVLIHLVEIPGLELGKAVAMRGIFDDKYGINAEMKQDGIEITPAASSLLRDVQNTVTECGPELGVMTGSNGGHRQGMVEKREEVLERIGLAAEEDGFLKKLLFPMPSEGIDLGRNGRVDLAALLGSSRAWYHLSIHPTDESPASLAALPSINSAWSAGTVSRQLRAWRLPDWANRRNKQVDFTADYDIDEFVQRFRSLGCMDGRDGIRSWLLERGWSNGEVVIGNERVWMRENAWWEAESVLDSFGGALAGAGHSTQAGPAGPYGPQPGSGFFPSQSYGDLTPTGSNEQLTPKRTSQANVGLQPAMIPRAPSVAPTAMSGMQTLSGDYGLGRKGDSQRDRLYYNQDGDFVGVEAELMDGKMIEEKPIDAGRRAWITFVWALTFWIPSPVLKTVGRMKRPDVRFAWREKVVLCFLILLANAFIIFWIVAFGKLLCPNFDKAWSPQEVSTHQGEDDFFVSVRGGVYDISKFYKQQHSDSNIEVTDQLMMPLAGRDVSAYFIPPLPLVCPGLGIANTTYLTINATKQEFSYALHTTGSRQADPTTALHSYTWYTDKFLPAMKEWYAGDLVWDSKTIKDRVRQEESIFIYDGAVYDLTDYFHNLDINKKQDIYQFLNADLTDAISADPGGDLTQKFNTIIDKTKNNATQHANVMNSLYCIKRMWSAGIPEFRYSARCQANNYILLGFTILLCAVILGKFLAALQFGSKRRPAPQDKFVICQVPAYTEGEDSLRKALDSLTALQYDNKRKLICVICDGIIVGGGNDRPTPKIVLDILGVDPRIDPPALPFKSVGTGSEQLNYGKVYSGLYEFEGNVVPYLVIVKVGKESEQTKTKPGNRGKRDSQILLMSFLNRVHHRAPMNPLELEMFHQVNNIIGVDPELYEYLLMIDADTNVREDALNRLVASCANDARIAGICGETSLQNEERSWWTMIQVYEYFISHHLAKAFESLFGSVTCLPGCFTMYRLRTADRGKPLIISDEVIRDYSDCNVDTLHKKNLLSLGEDRYLTTLMTKYFPFMSFKFNPNAYCQTAAPEKWAVLLSQRRRWINSTIHNLAELIWVKEMCGFCCFSMRFVVFIDLAGTIILPATCIYLAYLIYIIATRQGQFPLISVIMIAAVYGLQALIFIFKQQWQHVGWMIIYILAFPIYSFVLPIYSFWNQDNFSWGNTRIVIGETGKKQIVAVEDEGFDPRAIPLQRWDDYASNNNLPGRRGNSMEKAEPYEELAFEMEDWNDRKSVYSSVRQGSIITGFQGRAGAAHMPPQSPAFQASYPSHTPYSDNPMGCRQSMMSVGSMADMRGATSPYHPDLLAHRRSTSNLHNVASTSPVPRAGTSMSVTRLGLHPSESAGRLSTVSLGDLNRGVGSGSGPDDAAIVEAIQVVLSEVDLDTVTKKQLRALVEQRLQTELIGERRTFMDRQIDYELASF